MDTRVHCGEAEPRDCLTIKDARESASPECAVTTPNASMTMCNARFHRSDHIFESAHMSVHFICRICFRGCRDLETFLRVYSVGSSVPRATPKRYQRLCTRSGTGRMSKCREGITSHRLSLIGGWTTRKNDVKNLGFRCGASLARPGGCGLTFPSRSLSPSFLELASEPFEFPINFIDSFIE